MIRIATMAVCALVAAPVAAQPADVTPVAAAISAAAERERSDKAIPSIAVALIDRTGVVWSAAWGHADADRRVPATPASIYRAGSVSKLFTDIAVMRLVEQGRIDLDAPVQRYLPEFRPSNRFGGAITLRHLMTHRSGLVREPPRGHYFDASPKGQADAVASLNDTALVAAPGSVTKYSNAGLAVVGEVVARVSGKPYAQAVDDLVLRPLAMTRSGFADPRVVHAQMAAFDGGRWAAPTFDLGTPAAGNLYTDVGDAGRFVRMLLNDGAAPSGRLVASTTLAEMFRAQSPVKTGRSFGLGFALGTLDGQRTVGHGGAVYGHVADVRAMPDAGIGVVVFSTVDSGPTAQRIGSFALRSLLAVRQGRPLPVWQGSVAITGEAARSLSGRYVAGSDSANLRVFEGGLVLDAPELAGELRRLGDRIVLDDAQSHDEGVAMAPDGSWLDIRGRRFLRAAAWERPPPPDPALAALIGEYGWEYNILRVYQRDGRPYVRIEWTDWLPMTPVGPDRLAFPVDRGLYPLEELRFERDATGRVTAALLGAIRFPRRDFGAEAEASIRGSMATGIAALRDAARAASPPAEAARPSDLVAVQSQDPSIRLDIRYAGTNNFMGQQIYERSGAFLQRPAAQALARVNRALSPHGFGLLVHDAYRPWYVTKMFWDATPPANRVFVADPSQGSRHNRGAAVDLTMVELATGLPVVMPGRYDEFSGRSYSNYVGGSDEERWLRETLRTAMEREGFTVYPQEWWHFDLVGWQAYPIGNRTFDQLNAPR